MNLENEKDLISDNKIIEKKVVLTGLNNAGKTSILIALEKKYNFLDEIKNLTPTIKINYKTMDYFGKIKIRFWDMGGQEVYRNLYMKKPNLYFSDMDLLIYVIDIQDNSRFNESFNYFKDLLEFLEGKKLVVPVLVVFHKKDINLSKEKLNIIEESIDDWIENLTEAFPDWYFAFAETTIFNAATIFRFISFSLSCFLPNFYDIVEIFEKFREKTKLEAAMIFNKEGTLVLETYSPNFRYELNNELFRLVKEEISKNVDEDLKQISLSDLFDVKKSSNSMNTLNVKINKIENFYLIGIYLNEYLNNEYKKRISKFLKEFKKILKLVERTK